MECKDCKEFDICTKDMDEVCEDFKAASITSIVRDDDISEDTEDEATEETAEETEEKQNSTTDSIEKLINTVADAIKSNANNPRPEPKKKPFKLGFWGYLAIAVVAKSAASIVYDICHKK